MHESTAFPLGAGRGRPQLWRQEGAKGENDECRTGPKSGPSAARALHCVRLSCLALLMTTAEVKQDFESAIIKHVHFKSKLRSFLFGNGGEEGPLRDPEQCGLGLWIADRMRGTGPYAHLPEAKRFDQQHQRIHREANRLMDMHGAGRMEEVSAGYGPLQVIADEMVDLLQTMEANLRREA